MRTIEKHTKSKTSKTTLRPIMFPAKTVQLLEELLEASGTGLTTAEYAEQFLQQEIIASLTPRLAGVPEILDGSYQLLHKDRAAMEAVIERWTK